MTIHFTKFAKTIGVVALLSFSTNSFAGDIFGKVGYGHYPFKVVVGYNSHSKHRVHKPHYYKHHHGHKYSKRAYKHGYKHGYKKGYRHSNRYHYRPVRYCRSRY